MTVLRDAIRRHAQSMPAAVAIDGGGPGSLNWGELAAALDDAVDTSALIDPFILELDQGIELCVRDLVLMEAGAASVAIPPFFTSAQRAHVRNAVETMDVPPGTAKISFTSGSTGSPKGICLSSGHLLSVAQAVVDHVGDGHAGRHLPLLPPGILLENVAGFYATMLAGGTYAALPQADVGMAEPFRPDFPKMVEAISAHGITSLILVPEYLRGIIAVLEQTGRRLPALTLIAVGGARVMPELLERATALGLPVRQGYGMTEFGSVVALEPPGAAERGSVGTSIGVNSILIAEDGEVMLEGPRALGLPDGPFPTGDIGRIDAAGQLWIEGRKSNLIVTAHGRNISPEWVESALLAQPAIAQAMVYGDGESALSALIVPSTPDAEISIAIAASNATLPAYAQVRDWRRVTPFTAENGMLTSNGRLRRGAIRAAYLKGETELPFFDRLLAETRAEQQRFMAVPQLQAGLTGKISRAVYIDYLAQAYHHVSHTVPLFQEARARLAHRPELSAAFDQYIEEEQGHDQWILDDIRAAGGDPAAVVAATPRLATQAMVEHAYDVIRSGNPVAMFGMVLVLEGTSVAMAEQGAAAVRKTLGLPATAFSYLTSHGTLDREHLHFFADLMNRIDDPADQQAIIEMARDTYQLFGAMFAAIPLDVIDAAA